MGTLICKIELDKIKGAIVTIENPDAKITQTVSMDGTTLTMKVAGQQAVSTYVQDQAKIHITVNDLIVDAKTITVNSEKESKWKSNDIFSVESMKDMTLKTNAKMAMEATSDAKWSALSVTASAQTDAKLEGLNTTLKATAALKTEGTQVSIKATGPAGLEGAMVNVKASGMLTAESTGVATLKGAITNVTGSLVKLG